MSSFDESKEGHMEDVGNEDANGTPELKDIIEEAEQYL